MLFSLKLNSKNGKQIKVSTPPGFAAFIGIDWANQKHDVVLLAENSSKREHIILKHTLEAISDWVNELRERFGGSKVVIALEQSKGALIEKRMEWIPSTSP